MLCIKCQEEIYDTKICPYCGQNQNEEIEKPKFEEEPELNFNNEIKTCINCDKTFSKSDPECQLCPAMKDKFLEEEIEEEDIKVATKKSNKKTLYILMILLCIFVLIITLAISVFLSKMKEVAVATTTIMEEQLEYFADENGEITFDFSTPLDKDVAVEFITETTSLVYDIEIEMFELLEALNTYVQYNKFNIFENECKEINERVQILKKEFKGIETYGDPHLEGAKEYLYDKFFVKHYTYINTITQGIINRNIKNVGESNITTHPILTLTFAANMVIIGERAGMTQEEVFSIAKELEDNFVERIKPYYYRLPEEQQKGFEPILMNR